MQPLTQVLQPGDLAALRAGFSEERMRGLLTQVLRASYGPMAGYLDWFDQTLSGAAPLLPRDRERTLIALLCTQPGDAALAVHLYWGLMTGLSEEEVAHTLLLCAAYLGAPAYARAALLFAQVLQRLRRCAGEGAAACDCAALTRALLARLRPAPGEA